MKFDPGKAWPHPVLRPPQFGDDYPQAEFEAEIEVTRIKGSTAVKLSVEFALSDPDLSGLVSQGIAQYVLLIKSPSTHFRRLLRSSTPYMEEQFSAGALSGRVEFAPFLVCVQALSDFQAEGWHSDFSGRSFDLNSGAVLAEDEARDYWIDTADESPLGSIFGHKRQKSLPNGCWDYELGDDRIYIIMSDADAVLYEAAREEANNRPESQYLMNGLYLPALVAALNEIDQDAQEFAPRRWFASLDQRLETVGCKALGEKDSNRLLDAQKLLESPFLRMPIIANAEAEIS